MMNLISKTKSFTFFLIVSFIPSYSQIKEYSLDCIQGIWENIPNSIRYQNEKRIVINSGNKQLLLYYEVGKEKNTFDLEEYVIGFTNLPSKTVSLEKKDIIQKGKYFLTISKESANKPIINEDFSIEPKFDCDPESYYYANLGSGSPFEFKRISKIPSLIIQFLITRGLKDKRSYLNEFGISQSEYKQVEVISSKCYFYKEPKEATIRKVYIVQGDIATVIESKGDWLYIEYQGKNIVKGWVKGKDVKNL